MIGDQIGSSAKEIGNGGIIGLKGTAILNARVKSGERWSALASVKFTEINEDYTNLKVTELHYHPTDSLVGTDIISGQSFEFIELKNTGDKPINLSGLKFTSGIEYEFKETDVLAPKQFYVIASKPKWFYERHFMVPAGNFAKNFANSGEQVTISNSAGSPIIDTTDDLPESENSVSVYPNPTKGLLYLKADDENSGVQVKIYSLSGSMIFQSAIVGNSVIDLGSLNIRSGIYLVNTKCNDRNTVHKVVYQP